MVGVLLLIYIQIRSTVNCKILRYSNSTKILFKKRDTESFQLNYARLNCPFLFKMIGKECRF